VFIEMGLRHPLITQKKSINIFEMGFGTGLNAILTYALKIPEQLIHYHAVETLPLPLELVKELDYTNHLPDETKVVFEQMHQSEWNRAHELNNNFTLTKEHLSLEETLLNNNSIDLVFFDAFAPDKQPHLWSLGIFEKLFQAMKPSSVLVTYSSKGDVRRNLISAGFEVEKLDGPPFKRHMLRAIKPS
jgi:tRNA U34 5-methylaminomethyl-2-thiouridine-forming methyltransferase MnmC